MNIEHFKSALKNLYAIKRPLPIDVESIQQLKALFPLEGGCSFDFNQEQSESLKAIFLYRYKKVEASRYFYTSLAPGAPELNAPWITFAKILCGKDGIYSFHYYQLLMPFVKNTDELECIQNEKIKDLPLDSLLLTDEGDYLICLVSAIENAKANLGLLAIYRESKSKRLEASSYKLSVNEIFRFEHQNPSLWKIYKEFENNRLTIEQKRKEKLCITKSTIYALILAVEGGTFKSGGHENYNEEELKSSTKSYEAFIDYLHELSETERSNLMEQIITEGGSKKPFSYLWDCLAKNVCAASLASAFCRLILQYEPDHQFNSAYLSEEANIKKMEEGLIKKEYDNRNPFEHYESSEDYYHFRLISLMNEFLSEPAHNGSDKIDFYGETANVSPHIKKMFDCIVEGLTNKTYLEAYYKIQTDVILDNLSLYAQEKRSYQPVFFVFGQGVNLSRIEQSFLYQCLHGDFFEKNNLGVSGLSQEKILLKGLLVLDSLDAFPKSRALKLRALQYQHNIFTIFNALNDGSECLLSRACLCYAKIKALVKRLPEVTGQDHERLIFERLSF